MAKSGVNANVEKNRLIIIMDGFVGFEEVKAIMAKTVTEAGKLKPPFDVISDIRGFKPVTPEGFDLFKSTAAQVTGNDAARIVVRVDDQASVGSMQFKRLANSVGYKTATVGSVEEAERLLDEMN